MRKLEQNSKFYDKLYELLATLKYNSERGEMLEDVLKNFLIEKNSNMDICAKAREIYQTKNLPHEIKDKKEYLKSEWFKQECLLLSNIPIRYVPEYLIQKFSPFAEEFEKIHELDMDAILKFAFSLIEFMEFKKHMVGFRDEVYKFKSKEEYANPWFVSSPSKEYVEKWKNVVTFSIPELGRFFSGRLSTSEIKKLLKLLTINWEQLQKSDIRFPSTPLFRTDENTIILLTPWYLTRALPSTYESLFKRCKSYLESKGKSFEKFVQTDVKKLPFEILAFNVRYGNNYETDAIIKFKKSVWFTEISSHPPSLTSLKGDPTSIKRDLKIAIKKCIKQGKRCLEHIDEKPLSGFSNNAKNTGILIIVDGVYPQLNMNTHVTFFEEETRVYVINWFDFITILDQPEITRFEDFLLWRTQRPMPIICFDEKDYWAFYFDRYEPNEEMKRAFEIAKEKQIRAFYISYRFNAKDYLEKLVGS